MFCKLINILLYSALNSDLADSLGGITFGIDADGNYGYIKAGADTVTPFKSGGEIKILESKTNQPASEHCKNSQSYDAYYRIGTLDFGTFENPVCIVFSLSNWSLSSTNSLAYGPHIILNYKSPVTPGQGVYTGTGYNIPTYIHYIILQVS